MTRALIVATYLLASATAGTAIFMVAGVPTGLLTTVVLALCCIQMHSGLRRRRDKKVADREIAGLKRVSFQFEQALNDTRSKMDDMSKAIEAKTNAQGKKIVAELQVLETLMREFASKVANGAKAQPLEDTLDRRGSEYQCGIEPRRDRQKPGGQRESQGGVRRVHLYLPLTGEV